MCANAILAIIFATDQCAAGDEVIDLARPHDAA